MIFVDDGSADGTRDLIARICAEHANVRGVCLSRNFGKEAAIYAGIENARRDFGTCVAVIDCDLQYPSEKLCEMYRMWQGGYEVVNGVKNDRGKENPLTKPCVSCFYRLISSPVGKNMRRASDFKLLDCKAANAVLSMKKKTLSFVLFRRGSGLKPPR